VLSLRVSRDKRGYDHIYLLLEARRKGRTVTRLLYGGRWPSPMKIGQQPLDEATRKMLEQAYPEVDFDWSALQRTLQQALATPRAPMTPEGRRRSAAGRGGEGRPSSSGPGSGGGGGGQGGPGGRPSQGPGRVPPGGRPQMPPRQRPPYGPGMGDQAPPHERRAAHHAVDPRTLDDTADLPVTYRGAEADMIEPDTDVVDLPIQPYDEPVLEEGLDTEARRVALSETPGGPDEIEPVEERTFVVSSSGDDDSGEHVLAMDESAELAGHGVPADDRAGFDRAAFDRATFERPELPGAGFTRDEFPVAAAIEPAAAERAAAEPSATDPSAPPRRRRRRRRGGRRSHGGPNAASQPGGGPPPEGEGEPDHFASGPEGDEGHDDDSDV
jgi:hypothetical protein